MKKWISTSLLVGAIAIASAHEALDPAGTAKAFADALAKGDQAAVEHLLAKDVLIYESGGQESSRAEYMGHHMKGDMDFLAGATIKVLDRRQDVGSDQAWVATRSRITSTGKGNEFDLLSTETLVMKRTPEGWRIVHVQWSSRPAEAKKKS